MRKPLNETSIAAQHFEALRILLFVSKIHHLADEEQIVLGKMGINVVSELWAIPVFIIQPVAHYLSVQHCSFFQYHVSRLRPKPLYLENRKIFSFGSTL